MRESKADAAFPGEKAFRRLGGKDKLLKAVAAFCRAHAGFDDVLGFCEGAVSARENDADLRDERASRLTTGFVHLMKSGPHYKIGHTNSLGRREWELGIKIPVPPRTIHHVETDDPVGVEAYWHIVREALRLLERHEQEREEALHQLKAKLERGAGQAARGELLDGDEVFDELREMIEERRRAKSLNR